MSSSMSIGQVADAAGVSASAIRYYERHGLLQEPRRKGGKRRYEDDVLERLAVVNVAKQAGFTLEDVRSLFEATDRAAPAHEQLRELAERKLPEIDALIAHALEVKRWLEAVDGCTCDTLAGCHLFESGLRGAAYADDGDAC
jgi:MerR family redox-sensitive transcriptional activator SoxR